MMMMMMMTMTMMMMMMTMMMMTMTMMMMTMMMMMINVDYDDDVLIITLQCLFPHMTLKLQVSTMKSIKLHLSFCGLTSTNRYRRLRESHMCQRRVMCR